MTDEPQGTQETPPSPPIRRSRRVIRLLVTTAMALVLVAALAWVVLLLRRPDLGTFARLENRTTKPIVEAAGIEIAADLDDPPGDIAVSHDGRVFLTFHPTAGPSMTLVEMFGPVPHPYPRDPLTGEPLLEFDSPLAIHIDHQNRLWVLEDGHLTFGQPRLLTFDLQTDELVETYAFPDDVVSFGSMLTDFQVDPSGGKVYVADASPLWGEPALIVYDVDSRRSRRVLQGHPSVRAENVLIQQPPDGLTFLGYPVLVGLSSLALDEKGEWLYLAAMNNGRLYRVATEDLSDESLSPQELAARVEPFGDKPITGGMAVDPSDRLYLTDVENSAILRLASDREPETVLKSSLLRWPAGLAFGPDGWLWVACSSVHQFLFDATERHRPYFVIRFRPPPGPPG